MNILLIIQTIYTLIIILLFIVALWAILRPVSEDIEEPKILTLENCKKRSGYTRDNSNNDTFVLTDTPEYNLDVVGYNDMINKIQTTEYIIVFKSALQESFRLKRILYQEKLVKLEADLKNKSFSSGFGMIDQSVNLPRMKAEYNEIAKIMKSLDKREKNLTVEQVKLGLVNAFHNPEEGIDSIIGRDDIKDFLAQQLYSFSRSPQAYFKSFLNILIYGPSGIGKTKLAMTIAYVYSTSGILVRNKFRDITKRKITTAYINESGNLTREALNETLEGVLFIDEIYSMTPGNNLYGLGPSKDHGNEAIDEMVDFLDKNIGNSVVIGAGYRKQTEERFLGANEGMDRRFRHKIDLKEYTNNQLTDILLNFIEKNDKFLIKHFTPDMITFVDKLFVFILSQDSKIFNKQAGDMLNLSQDIITIMYSVKNGNWRDDKSEFKDVIIMSVNKFLESKKTNVRVRRTLNTDSTKLKLVDG